MELIRTGRYTLILDEELDVVQDFNSVQAVEAASRQTITGEDVKFLIEHHIISVGKDNRVSWCCTEYSDDLKFSAVQKYARLGRLFCVDGRLLLAVFPPEMFRCFAEIYIMTYLFSASYFRYYLDLFEIMYETVSVMSNEGGLELSAYNPCFEAEFRHKCKELIHICDNLSMNNYKGRNALSKSWYDGSTRNSDRLKVLRGHISNYFRRYLKDARATNGDIMWTTFNEFENKLKGKGYTVERMLSKEERKLPAAERETIKKELSCFVPHNARATNKYSDRWALVYAVNKFPNPMIRKFFTDGNDDRSRRGLPEIQPNDDLYGLSCMLQWIFRSRIRDGKSIEIYIPSQRMRQLLIDWLDEKI